MVKFYDKIFFIMSYDFVEKMGILKWLLVKWVNYGGFVKDEVEIILVRIYI